MSEEQTLVAEIRTKPGTSESRRIRRRGSVPGNLYGHQLTPVMLSVPQDRLSNLVHSGIRVLDLEVDGKHEKAMLRDLQWNTFGTHILHFDLIRIDADERVTVEVPVELKGVAPGIAAGGILDHHVRTLSLECPASQLPESITVRIHELETGDSIHVSDLDIPAGFEVHTTPETIVVQIVAAKDDEEAPEGAESGSAEPEVIGRKEEDESNE